MLYYLCKLDFQTALHIGDSSSARSAETSEMAFKSDTLFSALCHEALSQGGEALLNQLVNLAVADRLKLSDGLPYCGETLYLPRPITQATQKTESDPKERKRFKKMTYLPVIRFNDYLASLKGGDNFQLHAVGLPEIRMNFGKHETYVKVALRDAAKTDLYHVGTFSFEEDCGLYVIAGYAGEEVLALFKRLLQGLGLSGIGGKTSAGYGRFKIDFNDEIYLDEPCDDQTEILRCGLHLNAKSFMLMNLALPAEDEMVEAMVGSTYKLMRRGGFVFSEGYGEGFYKKKTGYLFASGSVFKTTFKGGVFDTARGGAHPVYRYAKPLFLGVDL